MTPDRLQSLLYAWHNGTASRDDIAELVHLLHDPSQKETLHSLFPGSLVNLEDIEAPETLDFIYKEMQHKLASRHSSVVWFRRPWLRYAAAVMVVAVAGLVLWKRGDTVKKIPAPVVKHPTTPADIQPGGDKAILTLGNGKTIVLDSAQEGVLATLGGTTVKKLANGELVYQTGENVEEEISFNTMSTPRGGQYQLELPDKSRVWLNAASSITFPSSFRGKERLVEMSGEVYFEVTRDQEKPFRVRMKDGSVVQVLGTSFNINDYGDESLSKTTLLSGSVSLMHERGESLLEPGQQAQIKKFSGSAPGIVDDVDVDQVMAWQKGMFEFSNTDLTGIMRQVSRWYDVDVVYDTKPTAKKFGGGISRKLPLSNVLKLLEANGVKFSLEGRVLRVSQ